MSLAAIALAPLQRVLNAASCYVADLCPCDHVKSVQHSLHWLPIHQRIQYILCILMYGTVPLTGMHPSTSPMVTLTSATSCRSHLRSSTSLGRGQGWAIVHSWSLVHAPGTHFRLSFVVHPVWTLLRSISNHICLLLLTISNNSFLSSVTVYCFVFYVLLYSAGHVSMQALCVLID